MRLTVVSGFVVLIVYIFNSIFNPKLAVSSTIWFCGITCASQLNKKAWDVASAQHKAAQQQLLAQDDALASELSDVRSR